MVSEPVLTDLTNIIAAPARNWDIKNPEWYLDTPKIWDDLAEVGASTITVDGIRWILIGDYSQARLVLQEGAKYSSDGERVLLEAIRGKGLLPQSLLSFRDDKDSRAIRKTLRQGLDSLPVAFEKDASLIREIEMHLTPSTHADLSEVSLSLSTASLSLLLGVPTKTVAIYEAWIRDGGRRITDAMLHQQVAAALDDKGRVSNPCASGLMAELLSREWSAADAAWALIWLSRASVRTLARALCNTFYAFSSVPRLPDFLNAGGEVKAAVTEILRLNPPTTALGRRAVDEQEILGHSVPPGSIVVPVLAAAQRDRKTFPAGPEFSPQTEGQPLLAFGWGRHSCLGETVARSFLGVVVDFIHERGITFTPAGEAVRHPSFCFSSWDKLPMTVAHTHDGAVVVHT
jgi:unspecific monooxygenase